MNTDFGNVYSIRKSQDTGLDAVPVGSLMELARSLRMAPRTDDQTCQRACIVVIAEEPARYRTLDFERIDVDWVLVSSPVEALDHLIHRGNQCVAVLTEVDLPGRDNGYQVLDALRVNGFEKPVFIVVHREPLAADKAFARRRGADDILLFRSVRMVRMLDEVLMGIGRVPAAPSSSSRRIGHPPWLPHVIRQLARYLGPSAGDLVRRRFVDMHARYHVVPGLMDLVEEVADTLNEWPDDKARFIFACSGAAGGDFR